MPHVQINDKISLFYEEYGSGALDADLIEETCDEADRFLRNAIKTKKWYLPVEEK